MSNSSVWPIDTTQTGATTPGQSASGNDGNEGVQHIPQSSRTGASPSDVLVSNPGHSVRWGFYLSTEMQSMYPTAPTNSAVE